VIDLVRGGYIEELKVVIVRRSVHSEFAFGDIGRVTWIKFAFVCFIKVREERERERERKREGDKILQIRQDSEVWDTRKV